jgi:hypothetical protein
MRTTVGTFFYLYSLFITMEIFDGLNQHEQELLLQFPAYVSLLAANVDGKLDDTEKKEAIQLTNIKRYSSEPLLKEFYKEVEKNFERNLLLLNSKLPVEKEAREENIKKELAKVEQILTKTNSDKAALLHKSMKSYADHVSKAHHTPLELFMIPFFISGLTD